MSRKSRFTNLELPRPARDANEESASSSRFESVEPKAAEPISTGVPQAHLARFGIPAAPELPLRTRTAGEQPFIRCMQCDVDSSIYVDRCGHCGAALDTSEQRAFNEALWA